MTRFMKAAAAGLVAIATTACVDFGPGSAPSLTASDFALAIAGTGESQSSYSDGSDGGLTGFVTGGFMQGGPRGQGGWMMGGGMGAAFVGAGVGASFGHRPFDNANCTYSATSGRVECPPRTRDNLTITRSFAFLTASGTSQPAFDSATTDAINTRTTVVGSFSGGFRRGFGHGFRHGHGPGHPDSGSRKRLQNDTTTVNLASSRTVSGLLSGTRTVNGTSGGTERTVGVDSIGRLTINRTSADTISGLKLPAPGSGAPYPTAGTIVRTMAVSIAYDGGSSNSSTRREVVTYNGTATASVTITQDGTTKNCTLPLPRGRLSCS
jgi:hypothetical protein